ncbi:hydroxymethylglutaryl-CoA lyase [Brevibacterium sp. 5221]|uniref:Hydroxymethylglutaryl-CoA lyase n=1 Tax=Brevibacterium rongguiense TaxID=2695267 RepID=A0A6N9H8F4_9MICO|nr:MULTISPECIES: hydroxymethylglutaryl-CoA lyase [Brevibacterium]MYM20348.1 hydroxymethylglutaryl-CoA lyase [Brevibacterium rongguiense]WAL41269.1 hydroxymethylglutaryl-CoA lyase [Brevibacterium sp. BRM-1]
MSPAPAIIRDVTLRDGLQLTGKPLPASAKAQLARSLFELGFEELEVGSLAHPKAVPAVANTPEVLGLLSEAERARSWVWVATARQVERAIDAGATRFQFCLSASDAHNRANVNRTAEQSMAELPRALELAATVGGRVQLCLATSFTCPFEGPVDPQRVLDLAGDPRAAGTPDIVIADTLGQASPAQVSGLIARVAAETPQRRIVFHGHDTWGQGTANALAAVQAGAGVVDGALGGLGGCPFAPGASGNTATEDLLFALRPDWLDPAGFHAAVGLGAELTERLDEPNRSRAAEGARAHAPAFPWALPAQ